MIAELGRVELKLLLRNRTAALTALAMPAAMGVFFAMSMGGDASSWVMVAAFQLAFTLGLGVYVSTATALVARRQDLYLKRLRTVAADRTVLAGIVGPTVVLGCVQAVVLLGVSFALGAPMPANPHFLLIALVLGAAMSAAAGVATSGVTATPELAQTTTLPFFAALLAGVIWAGAAPDDQRALLLPGSGLFEAARAAWAGPTDRTAMSVLVMAVWTAAAMVAAHRYFRWDRRD
ncbi:hypothetical protein GCM10022243_55830 [Saccharothrix violaceirubra]|uniref:ABC-2 type transport system permease protein n=1 Tax=Saccharothrix violaceirubra TaxID=413306 RepID=A0A7W7T5R6_9PSEU|nr:ABC transporter permease [Saccharothrix violaceirubra]MBB4967093.1 ABC-2 type transport system permease protein [Saccharothrix violaceirubra]